MDMETTKTTTTTKLTAGNYRVHHPSFGDFGVFQALNENLNPTGEWHLTTPNGEWTQTFATKRDAVAAVEAWGEPEPCPATCHANGRRCELVAGHDGLHDFIGVPHPTTADHALAALV